MYKTIGIMILAMAATVFAALLSNDFSDRALRLADAGGVVAAPVSERLALPAERIVADDVSAVSNETEATDDMTLDKDRAAALLFMGVLRDN